MNIIKNRNQEIIDEFGHNTKLIYDIINNYNAIPVGFINENHHYLFNVIINNGESLYYRRLYINTKTLKNHTTKFSNGTMYGN